MSEFSKKFSNKSPLIQKELHDYGFEIDNKEYSVTGHYNKRGKFKPTNKKGFNEKLREKYNEKPTKTFRKIKRNKKKEL